MRITLCSIGLTLIFPLAFLSSSVPDTVVLPAAHASASSNASVINVSDVIPLAPAHGKAQIKKLALGANAFIGELTIQPGAKVPVHRDPTEEYLYVLTGGGNMTLNGKVYSVKKGDVVYMPAGAEVSFVNGKEITKVMQVFAGPGPASKYDGWQQVTR